MGIYAAVNQLFQLLAENEIDGEAFLLLSHEDVKDLVKVVGPRTKLMKKKMSTFATRCTCERIACSSCRYYDIV